MTSQTLGTRLRDLRDKQGLSLSEVARRAKVSKAYVSQLERGGSKDPSYSVVIRLATALGTTPENLTGQLGPWDPTEIDALPRSLRTFAEQNDVPSVDVDMLSRIHYRGKRPKHPEDWAHLYETIKRTIR